MKGTALDTMGKRIKHLREKIRLTQAEVATKIGISQSAYNRYEKDEIKRYSESTLEKLALALEASTDFILGQEGKDTKLDQYPPEVKEWLLSSEAVPFVVKAYMEYQHERLKGYLK